MKKGPFVALGIAAALIHGLAVAEPADLVFSLVLEKEAYRLSDEIRIGFKLENRSKKPLYVNKRFKLGSFKADPDQREVVLEVKSVEAGPVEMKPVDYPTGLPKSEYFERLQPGQEAVSERDWDLKSLAKIERPGAYELTATYQNVFGKELGLEVFRRKLTTRVLIQVSE